MTVVGSFTLQQPYFLLPTEHEARSPSPQSTHYKNWANLLHIYVKKLIFTAVSDTHKHSACAIVTILRVSRFMSTSGLVTRSVDSLDRMWKELAQHWSVGTARLPNPSAVTATATSSRGSYSDHCPGTGNELQTFQYGLAAGCHTYLLTPWSRVLFEKLTGSAAGQEIPRIFGTRRFLTVIISARHLSLSWVNSIQSPQLPPTSWRYILILSSHLCVGLPSGLFPSGLPNRTLCTPLPSPIFTYYKTAQQKTPIIIKHYFNTFLSTCYFILVFHLFIYFIF